jgi:signal transduction histidine kinase/ligand-binding sensor domain-containing protein/CheY-like chemotaxis protein
MVVSFHLDKQNILWVGTAGEGIFQINLNEAALRLTPFNLGGKINRYLYLNAFHQDNNGFLWTATTEGLHRIDGQQIVTYRPSADVLKSLSSVNVQAAYHDRSGTLWVGTNNGIDRQVAQTKPFQSFHIKPNQGAANLFENKINVIFPDGNDQLWTSNTQRIFRADLRRKQVEMVSPDKLGDHGKHENFPSSMISDGAASVWIGTWDGLYQYDKSTNKYTAYPSEVHSQFISRGPTGDIWLGGEGGIGSFNPITHRYTYYKYDPANMQGLPDKFVYAILASRAGDVWVAVNGKGISRLNPKTGRFTHYVASANANRLNSNEVLAFYEDRQGILWIGTNQGGLNRLDPRTGMFTHFTKQEGLPSNRVVSITADKAGHLWLGTSRGLCRFDPRTKSVRNYTISDGLPSNDFLENAVAQQNNHLYFGTLNGLVYFNPDSIRDDTRPFPVHITSFKVVDRNHPLAGKTVTLKHNENFLSFEFAALTYFLPEKSQYSYQLTGIDNGWVQNGNRRFVNYTNLPPGSYTFQVKASNSDGVWNDTGTSISITILPPWWATWWAYCLYGLVIAGIIAGGLRFYLNRLKQQQEFELNRREAEQLKAVDELKTRFFSNITHEFRTPLSLIISPVEKLLQEKTLEPATRQKLSLVRRNAHQLLQLINQLLDLSKLEAQSMPVALLRGQVAEYAEQLVESFREAAEQKNIQLFYTTSDLDEERLFDADKWGKILTNLLSNALKFTNPGGQIRVTMAPDETDSIKGKPNVRIVVADTGVGIAADHLTHIFDRFYQADDSRTREHEGTGIGLALVKELTDLMGGTIHVESKPAVGTTFTLCLPVQPVSDDSDAPTVTLPTNRPRPINEVFDDDVSQPIDNDLPDQEQSPVVLVVEDNPDLREFIVSELSSSYRVLSAANGEEGWLLAQAELPDVVISDLMMPRMDGYELTRLIKNHPATDHIAVILLTAKTAQLSRMEGLQQGADEYLTKPFNLEELSLRVRNLINRQEKLREEYSRHMSHLAQSDSPLLTEGVDNPFIRQIHELIDSHLLDSALSVDRLADDMAMSRKTLYRKIQSLTQLSPNELIRQRRIHKAAELLRAGKTPSETAYLTGFKTPSHFATVFKEYYQKTPSEFLAMA